MLYHNYLNSNIEIHKSAGFSFKNSTPVNHLNSNIEIHKFKFEIGLFEDYRFI